MKSSLETKCSRGREKRHLMSSRRADREHLDHDFHSHLTPRLCSKHPFLLGTQKNHAGRKNVRRWGETWRRGNLPCFPLLSMPPYLLAVTPFFAWQKCGKHKFMHLLMLAIRLIAFCSTKLWSLFYPLSMSATQT